MMNAPGAKSVAGDVFRFKQTDGILVGEAKVSGDEMSGYVAVGNRMPMSLRRVDASAVPRPRQ